MNIEKDFEYRIRDLNKKLNQATLDGNVPLARSITQEIVRTEKALESARKIKPMTPPVQMPKRFPAGTSPASAAAILRREQEEKKRKAESEKLAKQVNQYVTGGIVTTSKQGGKTELQNAFLQIGQQMGHTFEQAQQQMEKILASNSSIPPHFNGIPTRTEKKTRNGKSIIEETIVDIATGDEITVVKDGVTGKALEMRRIQNPGFSTAGPRFRPPAKTPIEAKIALTQNGNIKCSGEVVKAEAGGCNGYYCKHRADWFNKIESVGTFSQFLAGMTGAEMVTKTVFLPLCYGLVVAEASIQVRRVGEENSEGWAEYYIQHAIHQGDIVVSMKLTPHKGDTLKVAIRAIEDFYKMQPEHDLVLATDRLPCSLQAMHTPGHEHNAIAVLHDMGIQNAKHLADIIATANSFTQLNTPGDDNLCVLCYRSRWMLP